MCGICGVFAYGRAGTSVDESLIVSMRERMAHRGPDDAGVYLSGDGRLGLGFRRLSILDLTASGHQPMANRDGTVWIVFNGEIYNHAEERARLEKKGYAYRGRSDTETLLYLYEEHGAECVRYLRGMYAFAVWDERQGRLFLARDRMGIKPLYYAYADGVFLFASEIKALLAHPGLTRELNDEALYHYLTFMIPPAPLTLFKGVSKLPPGCTLTIDRSGHAQQDSYWDPLDGPREPLPAEQCVLRIRELLDESVRLQMMSDVPFGAFLSGGIDSSTIAALMSRHSSQPVNTFTVGYKDSPASNELPYARRVADALGTRHHEVMIGAAEMLEYMPRLVQTQDEPIADPVCVPLFYVSKLARDNGVEVVQVGEGSDELFGGYAWYPFYAREHGGWERWRRRLPGGLLRAAYAAAARAASPFPRASTLEQVWERRSRDQPAFWGSAVVYSGRAQRDLLATKYWEAAHFDGGAGVQEEDRRAGARWPEIDAVGRMTYLELRQRLPELLLMRVDKVTMSLSLEARVPFLDHRLVEFVLPLPMSMKLNDGPKALLKKAVRGLLPDDIIDRRKQGFPAPVGAWFSALRHQDLRHVLLESPLARRGCFNLGYVERLLAEQASGRRDWSIHLWVLYNLNVWYSHWFEAKDLC